MRRVKNSSFRGGEVVRASARTNWAFEMTSGSEAFRMTRWMCAISKEIGFLGAFGEAFEMMISRVSSAAQQVS